MAEWIDAKCNNCGLQREVILFIEPTKPRDALRCPRCASLDVNELRHGAIVQKQLDEILLSPGLLNIGNSDGKNNQ